MKVKSLVDASYFVIFIDDTSRKEEWTYAMKPKDKV